MRTIGVIAAAPLLLGLPAPAQRAAAVDAPRVHSITFSREAITVSGNDVKLLTVSAHLSDADGIAEEFEGSPTPRVRVGPGTFVQLVLGSGTPQDGIYTGGIAITSDWSGTYRPTLVHAQDIFGTVLDVDPGTVLEVPEVTVTSTGRPQVRMDITPVPVDVGAPITQTVTATDAAGRPLAGVPVGLGEGGGCPDEGILGPTGRTDAAGVFTGTWRIGSSLMCAWIGGDNVPEQAPTRIAAVTGRPRYRYLVTAEPESASVRAGTNVVVHGSISPFEPDKDVELERRYPDGRWHTVNRGRTSSGSSSFNLVATPPGRATYSYRVAVPGDPEFPGRATGYSPVFTIRGT